MCPVSCLNRSSGSGDVQFGVDLPDFKSLLCDEFPDVMIPYLDVLRLRVYDRIPHEVYCALRVAVEGRSR